MTAGPLIHSGPPGKEGKFLLELQPRIPFSLSPPLTFLYSLGVNRITFDLRVWHPCPINVNLPYHPIDNIRVVYCNTVEWCWWDSSLICKTSWLPSVL